MYMTMVYEVRISVFNGKENCTIVAPDKSVSVTSPLDAVDMLFTFLQRYVHVAINGDEFPCVLTSVLQTENPAHNTN
jgi:hypothetical protein